MYRLFCFSFFFCALDQLSKWYVIFHLELKTQLFLNLNNPIINFQMAWNTGINFGLFHSDNGFQMYLLSMISVFISIGILVYFRKNNTLVMQASAALIIGGAWGNATDRLLHGAVADFINVTCCNISNPFSFNVADVFIVLGVVGIFLFNREQLQD